MQFYDTQRHFQPSISEIIRFYCYINSAGKFDRQTERGGGLVRQTGGSQKHNMLCCVIKKVGVRRTVEKMRSKERSTDDTTDKCTQEFAPSENGREESP